MIKNIFHLQLIKELKIHTESITFTKMEIIFFPVHFTSRILRNLFSARTALQYLGVKFANFSFTNSHLSQNSHILEPLSFSLTHLLNLLRKQPKCKKFPRLNCEFYDTLSTCIYRALLRQTNTHHHRRVGQTNIYEHTHTHKTQTYSQHTIPHL